MSHFKELKEVERDCSSCHVLYNNCTGKLLGSQFVVMEVTYCHAFPPFPKHSVLLNNTAPGFSNRKYLV